MSITNKRTSRILGGDVAQVHGQEGIDPLQQRSSELSA